MGPLDAIALSAAHQTIQATSQDKSLTSPPAKTLTLEDEFHRVREDLVRGIGPARSVDKAPPAELDYVDYRQRYLEIERRMDWRIEPFRGHCRQVLSQTSTRLKQLAELDAAMEQLLAAREKALLAKVPALMERRFKYVKKTQGEGSSWIAIFDRDFREVMLAELHFRLEPIVGLIEALRNEA